MIAPDPPYPPDIRARGWRFELDVETLKRSDTWALASPSLRPWCLMLWMSAWDECPIGLPSDDAIIAAKIGMPLDQFLTNRSVLLRGWTLCADGRLYHKFVTKLVNEMVAKRAADRDRTARWRETRNVEKANGVSHPLVTRDSPVSMPPTTHHPTVKQKPKPSSSGKRPPDSRASDLTPGFMAFWEAYPAENRRNDRGKCATLWRQRNLEPLTEEIVSHVTSMRQVSPLWLQGMEPEPIRYLANRRWEDGLPTKRENDRPAL